LFNDNPELMEEVENKIREALSGGTVVAETKSVPGLATAK